VQQIIAPVIPNCFEHQLRRHRATAYHAMVVDVEPAIRPPSTLGELEL